ncbi:hypothetical protein [Flavobacterium sp. GT3R68]|uniref:hypothetical protein n=1 Tax=Flavobacterium sp. GT3R68 TaxID=2594437 RepID=UPI000F8675F9|nr:hypothetical protein [Flavobacterium sp. GT3R68]RTY90609.1 hypothetical protein EKL32_20525 [Flavobacterium sp. GSN2]TRW89865.1 hypothetical protein FNW07_12540 [Flavobacterium sp. GT3R68]
MKKFYTIVQLAPNKAAGDTVAIGMLLFDGSKLKYYISDKKKNIALKLLNDKNVDIDFFIKQITNKCDIINNDIDERNLFNKYDKISDVSYINYLSNYSNGLLQFSKPTIFFDEVDDFKFNNLINLFFNETIFKNEIVIHHEINIEAIVQNELIEKVNNKIHTNYKFSPSNLNSIYFPFEMDCIGLNGSLIGAKSMSFEKSKTTLDKNLSHYFTLISMLSSKYNKSLKDNKFYLITEEPSEINSEEHTVWESIVKNELVTLIHPEESNIVADLVFEKNAGKFLEEVSE